MIPYKEKWIIAARSYSISKFWEALMYHKMIDEIPLNDKYSISHLYQEQKLATELGCKWLCFYESEYPQALKKIINPPPVILAKGNLDILQKEVIAVSGARNCSQASAAFIKKIAEYCNKFDYPIISGLALGIDTAAHYGSLSSGTIAVIPGGFTSIFPSENQKLYEQILENNGAVLTATAIDTHITKKSFNPRNSIIAAYGKILILADAANRSGSLITAKYALDYGKEIFVVPGHPADPRSEGGNRIIQNGGNLLQTESDLNDILNIYPVEENKKEINFVSEELFNEADIKQKLLNLITVAPINAELLAEQLNISPHRMRSLLIELNLDNKIIINCSGEVFKSY